MNKQNRVADGLARAEFPYADYSLEELDKLYPQTLNENVATTRAPQETHKMFVSALKNGDLDEAVECCFRKGDWDEMKENISEIKKNGKLDDMIKDISVIEESFVGDTIASYIYYGTLNQQKFANTMSFIKDGRGIWLIESL